MKSLIVMATLLISTSAFSSDFLGNSTLGTFAPTALITGVSWTTLNCDQYANCNKKAALLLMNDSQDLIQTGKASPALSQMIQTVQKQNEGISELEALDLLINDAQTILEN